MNIVRKGATKSTLHEQNLPTAVESEAALHCHTGHESTQTYLLLFAVKKFIKFYDTAFK